MDVFGSVWWRGQVELRRDVRICSRIGYRQQEYSLNELARLHLVASSKSMIVCIKCDSVQHNRNIPTSLCVQHLIDMRMD